MTTTQETKPFDGTIEETFFFREKKVNGTIVEPKRPEFKATIPAVSNDTILEQILANLEQDEAGNVSANAEGAKLLGFIAQQINDAIYSEAQGQIAAKLASFGEDTAARVAYQLQATDLDQSKLTLTYLLNKPKAERKGPGLQFSEELVKAASDSFINYAIANIKNTKGELLSREGADNASKEIFLNRFKNTKSNKALLELFQQRITLWLAGISEADQQTFAEFAQFLLTRLDTYLNPDQESIFGKFE